MQAHQRIAEQATQALIRPSAIVAAGNVVAVVAASPDGLLQSGPGSRSIQQHPPARRRRWYLGIQSKKDPAHVMTEVYKALLQLACEWQLLDAYRIQCHWLADSLIDRRPVTSGLNLSVAGEPLRSVAGEACRESAAESKSCQVRIMLTLYKVQQNIYLLDFQKVGGDAFGFMILCAKVHRLSFPLMSWLVAWTPAVL